ncbi:MAG: TetR/AcrR family transcriptional regulator [Candidatus Loosdrechtia sp.]|uniref:TetR/AcrR family transcriptional regulator n=1 Tax=Candidatus Loosdrechtia sp. TaxID=3101272 RepID=UPI003A5ECCCD|nr:MAG: TetR/AcrR family transcriptional regulator [Candidatus Jettenia sp. AMX2]
MPISKDSAVYRTEETLSTREKILEASLKLFSSKGYLGTTTREIASEAGIAEVTLFRYFPSKEKLFEEVINTNSFLPTLRGILPKIMVMSYREALTVIAARFLETLTLRKDLIQIMHLEIQRYPEKIQKIYHAFIDEMFKTLASYFKAMQEKTALREFDAETAARAFLGMFFSYFTAEEFLLHKKYKTGDTNLIISEFVGIFIQGTLR